MTTLDTIIRERFDEGDSAIEVTPVVDSSLIGQSERAFLFVNGDRDQVLVDFGWGDGGFYVDVRMFVDGEPIEPTIMELGHTVTVNGRLPDGNQP